VTGDIDRLIDASSLGTPHARALRAGVTAAGELTGMPEEQADWEYPESSTAVGQICHGRRLAETRHIEELLQQATHRGCGVRVDRYYSKTMAVVDPTIPAGELQEHHHTAADGYRRWADLTQPQGDQ
jgi:hypothetical protein